MPSSLLSILSSFHLWCGIHVFGIALASFGGFFFLAVLVSDQAQHPDQKMERAAGFIMLSSMGAILIGAFSAGATIDACPELYYGPSAAADEGEEPSSVDEDQKGDEVE